MDNLDLSPCLTDREKHDYRRGYYTNLSYWVMLECRRLCDPDRYEKQMLFHAWVQSIFDDADKNGADMWDDNCENFVRLEQWIRTICMDIYKQFAIGPMQTFWYIRHAWECRYAYDNDWVKFGYRCIPPEYRQYENSLPDSAYTTPKIADAPIDKSIPAPKQLPLF